MPVYYFSQNHIIKIYFKHTHTHVKNWMETHQKYTPWCWERLKVGGKGDNRGWDGWMASPTQWTWVWVISGSWWWTGRPGVLQSTGSQRVRHNWVTGLNWMDTIIEELECPSSFSVQFSSVAQSCPTLCDPMDCNPPGSSVHEILQARILVWVASSCSNIHL